MEQISGERRKMKSQTSFPLVDTEGHEIVHERRSGLDRRKGKRESSVAESILNLLD